MHEVDSRLNSKTAGFGYSVCAVCYVLLSIIGGAIVNAAHMDLNSDGYKYFSYLVAPVGLAIGCAITLLCRGQKVRTVAPVRCKIKYYFIALLMIFGLFGLLNQLNTIVTEKIFVPLGYEQRPPSSYLPDLGGGRVALALTIIALIPALSEEFFFRGVLLNNCRASAGDIPAVFITGFAFALFHGSPEQTVYQFICGCAFALVAVRSGSVLPGMLMHFLNNAAVLVFNACGLCDMATGNLIIPFAAEITLMVTGAVALAAALILLILDRKPWVKRQKGGIASFFIYASAGVAALAVIWISQLF